MKQEIIQARAKAKEQKELDRFKEEQLREIPLMTNLELLDSYVGWKVTEYEPYSSWDSDRCKIAVPLTEEELFKRLTDIGFLGKN